jgi:5-methylcytosine-specific restriction endonuclease McrA
LRKDERDAAFWRRVYASSPRQKERRLEYQREYHQDPEQRRRRARNQRAYIKRQRERIFVRDGWLCVYCGQKRPKRRLVIDHKMPVALGGTDDDGNLVTSCRKCNRAKGTMTYDEYRLHIDPSYVPSWVTEETPTLEPALEPF